MTSHLDDMNSMWLYSAFLLGVVLLAEVAAMKMGGCTEVLPALDQSASSQETSFGCIAVRMKAYNEAVAMKVLPMCWDLEIRDVEFCDDHPSRLCWLLGKAPNVGSFEEKCTSAERSCPAGYAQSALGDWCSSMHCVGSLSWATERLAQPQRNEVCNL